MTPPSSTSRSALAAALTRVTIVAGLATHRARGVRAGAQLLRGHRYRRRERARGPIGRARCSSSRRFAGIIRNTSFGAQASWLAGSQAHLDGDASIGGRYFSPVYRHLRFELGASAQRTAGPDVIAVVQRVCRRRQPLALARRRRALDQRRAARERQPPRSRRTCRRTARAPGGESAAPCSPHR